MHHFNSVVILFGVLLVAGCASQPASTSSPVAAQSQPAAVATETKATDTSASDANTGQNLICRYENPTGSHRVIKRCFTAQQLKEQTESTQQGLGEFQRMQTMPSFKGSGG